MADLNSADAGALASFARVESLGETTARSWVVRSIRRRAATLMGIDLRAIGDPAASDPGERREADSAEAVALAVAEQFVVDVTGVDDSMRARLGSAFGPDTFGVVQAIYVADYTPRVRWALHRLLGLEPERVDPSDGDLWATIQEFMGTVARLDALDPGLTEVVRLRGARIHDCRLCKSLRNVTAVADGVDEVVVDAIDHYETSNLSERTKVALRVTDAVTGRPGDIDEELIGAVTAHFDHVETVELVLDIMRNAGNKIAVCLGADAAHVDDGIEYYDIDESGEPVYGLSAPSA